MSTDPLAGAKLLRAPLRRRPNDQPTLVSSGARRSRAPIAHRRGLDRRATRKARDPMIMDSTPLWATPIDDPDDTERRLRFRRASADPRADGWRDSARLLQVSAGDPGVAEPYVADLTRADRLRRGWISVATL